MWSFMRLPYSKTPRKRTDLLLDRISAGKCSDSDLKEFLSLLDATYDRNEVEHISNVLLGNIEQSSNALVLAYSIQALLALPPLPREGEEQLIRQIISILKVPVNNKHKVLHEAIMKFIAVMVNKDIEYARLMIPELIACMDERYGTIGINAYNCLFAVATAKPEYFENKSGALVKLLGSINKNTRAKSAKLIGIIARVHPEYVSRAMPTLEYLSIFHPDPAVKNTASEAYQILSAGMKAREEKAVELTPPHHVQLVSGGFADIMKRKVRESTHHISDSPDTHEIPADTASNESPDNAVDDAVASVSFEDDDIDYALKELMDKVKNDFEINAGSILDSMGMGYLKRNQKKDMGSKEHHPAGMVPVSMVSNDHPAGQAPDSPIYALSDDSLSAGGQMSSVPASRDCSLPGPPDAGELPPGSATNSDTPVDQPAFLSNNTGDNTNGIDNGQKVDISKWFNRNRSQGLETIMPDDPGLIGPSCLGDIPGAGVQAEPDAIAGDITVPRIGNDGQVFTEICPKAEDGPHETYNDPAGHGKDEGVSCEDNNAARYARSPIIPAGAVIHTVKQKAASPNNKQDAMEQAAIEPGISPVKIAGAVIRPAPADITDHTNDLKTQEIEQTKPEIIKMRDGNSVPIEKNGSGEYSVKCPACGIILPADAQFCIACGTRIRHKGKFRCDKCGSMNIQGARFCMVCGAELDGKGGEVIRGHFDIS